MAEQNPHPNEKPLPSFLFQTPRMTELRSVLDGKPTPKFLIPPPPVPEAEIKETQQADIVIVGEGFAALCCALRARQAGADVLIVTASKHPVGRGGSVFAAYSKVMAEHGLPREDLDNFLLEEMEARAFQLDQRKYYRFINHSEEAMNWLIDLLRAHGVDSDLEDANEDAHDSPTYMPPGTHFFVPKSPEVKGFGIGLALSVLEKEFLALGGRLVRETVAEQLEKDGARVVAVLARKPDGGYLRAVGKRALVLATGDFSRNREMMEFFCPQYAEGFAPEPADYDAGFSIGGLMNGDGHRMAMWAGAAWQRTWPCAPMIQGSRAASNMPYGSHRGLRLNVRGERYCNEDMNGAYTALTCMREPEGKAFIIWGSNYADEIEWRNLGGRRDGPAMTKEEILAAWELQIKVGKAVRGDTLEEVLDKLGLPKDKAMAEIERYNGFCRTGKDPDFHKSPKYLQEIREAPFYGATLVDHYFFTVLGGPRTNWKMQICDANDDPIPGLYCLGTMMGDFYAACYNFRIPGENYGSCLTFGYLTGEALARGEL